MTRYIKLVTTKAVPGADDQLNDWYDRVHMPEVLALDGYVSGQRFVLLGPEPSAPHYLAVYEIESDNIEATLATMSLGAQAMEMSEALDLQAVRSTVYKALGERRLAERPPQ